VLDPDLLTHLSPLHQQIITAARTNPGESVDSFGFSDVFMWQTDESYLHEYKSYFVHAMRDPIKDAAQMFDLPPELIAGTAYIEVGGKDPLKGAVYQVRRFAPFTSDADRTSLGPLAMQVRRAVETLGYDPATITDVQREAVISSLNDPSQAVYLAAAHLSDLRNVDYQGVSGSDLTEDQIRVIGARYNQGPDRSLSVIQQDLSYGNTIVRRWRQVQRLLSDQASVPRPEWNPIENNVVEPVERRVNETIRQLNWCIMRGGQGCLY
jgi:hypothetical protein